MDEDFFSDDATLDALPEDELQALEDAAVRGTQYPLLSQFLLQPQQQHQQSQYNFNINNSRTSSYNPPQLPVGPPLQKLQARFQQRQNEGYQQRLSTLPTLPYTNQHRLPETQKYNLVPVSLDNPASSDDYGGFDETTELWDTVAPKAQKQDLKDLQQYYEDEDRNEDRGQNVNGYGQRPIDAVHEDDRVNLVGEMMMGVEVGGEYNRVAEGVYASQEQVQEKLQQRSSSLEELTAKIAELKNEKEHLQEDLRSARATVTSKNGEISVVRRNNAKSEAAHRAAIALIEQKQSEERERLKLQLEAVEAELERMRTEMVFLRKELEEVAKQNRNLAKKAGRQQIMAVGESMDLHMSISRQNTEPHKSPATTPRRNKGYAFRDGFEDEEMLSPSKAKGRSPMKPGIKRKRSLMDSPKTTELLLSHPKKTVVEHTPIQVVDEMLLEKLWIEDDRFEFFKAVMAHRPAPGMERSFDGLSKFSFPSSPGISISSLFQDKVTLLQPTAENPEFSAGVCEILLSIWRGCLEECLYGALNLVLGLLQFSIVWDQGSTCHRFFEEAIDLVQQTVDINAIPMLKRNLALLEEDIDIGVYLRLLEGIALGILGDERCIKRFWRCIRSDFPLMMVNPNQRLQHIQQMASILSTSCLGDSFGPLVSNEADQRANEGHLLEAVTKVLVSTPRAIPGEPRNTKVEITEVRRDIIQLLGGISGIGLGLEALARHPSALTRLVRRMADELEDIYEYKFGREQSVQLVNLTMRLLHGILPIHGQVCMSKIATPSTSHKYLVAMTRLAFSEGLSQELGIDDNTRKFAQELLESTITPEEAESLEMLFSPS